MPSGRLMPERFLNRMRLLPCFVGVLLLTAVRAETVYLENAQLKVGVETAGGVLVFRAMPNAPCPDPANGQSRYSPMVE